MLGVQFVFLISIFVCCAVGYISGMLWFSDMRNRRMLSFFLLSIEIFFWSLLNAITMVCHQEHFPAIYTLRMMVVCIIPFGVTWFILDFCHSPMKDKVWLRNMFIAIPAVDILCLITNPLHYMYFSVYSFPLPERAPIFWVHLIISFLIVTIAFIVLVRFTIKKARDNPLMLLTVVALLIPYSINLLFSFRVITFQHDLTPIGFFFTFILFVFVAYRSQLFNVKTALFSTTMDSIVDVIIIFNERNILIDANKSALGVFSEFPINAGRTKADALFKYLSGAAVSIQPEDLTSKVKSGEDVDGECVLEISGGSKQTYTIYWRAVYEGKRKTGFIFMMVDVSKYREMMVRAEEASQAKSSFLSNMSHEIRTPMNAILGITDIQLQNENLAPDVREALNKIYSSGDMLLGIINDILDLSKIEAGKLELYNDNYHIASIISDTAQLNAMRIGSKPIEFELLVDENTPAVLTGDELRIKQIMNNVLSNAFKYTDAGTVKLSVSTEPGGAEDAVTLIIEISDTGQGMTKEQVDKLFEKYVRFNIEANRTTEGTGLGMNITHNLVSLMNGSISVVSEPGAGTTVTIKAPQRRAGSDVLGKEMAENLHNFRTSDMARMKRVQITREPMPYGKVLIVDDVETNLYVASGLLAPYLLSIDTADSGFEAIDKIKSGMSYDIVFMDHMMPKMDGVETTRILRSMGYDRFIVALTANAVTGQAEIFLQSGFDDFISKPIDVRQLNAVLNKLIRDMYPPEVVEESRRQAKPHTEPLSENGRQPSVDPKLAEIFLRDAKKSLAALDEISQSGVYGDEDMRSYVILVHGMKSALKNIGKAELSAAALRLETLGREGNIETVSAETPAFLSTLRELISELTPKEEPEIAEASDDDSAFLREQLLAVKAACEEFDESAADKIITGLREKPWPRHIKEMLASVSEHLLHSDFDEAAGVIERFIG